MNNYLANGPIAQITNPVLKGGALEKFINDTDSSSFLGAFLPKMIGLMFVVGTILFVFMLVIGAIGWIASGGEKSSIESARGKITNAVIGLIILFSTFAIFQLIEKFFGFNILTIDMGPLVIQ